MRRLIPGLLLLALMAACGATAETASAEPAAPVETWAAAVEAGMPEEEPETASKQESEIELTAEPESVPEPETPKPLPEADGTEEPAEMEEVAVQESVYLEIGDQRFSVTLDDSPTAQAFRELLPVTWEMEELHGNEKFIYLDSSLPSNAQPAGFIETGDLMLYGDSCIVLFYESFSTSYSYTRIGWIEDPASMAEILGDGDVTVRLLAEG